MNIKNKIKIFSKQLFSINNFDGHRVIYFLGFHIKKKIKNKKYDITITNHGLNKDTREEKIILSLTSFPERINIVHKTIITLLNQTLKADKIILWLADSQFPNKEKDLPEALLKLKEYGLEIKWCKDIKSYKKLIPALKKFKNDIIITFDDDIYYENNVVEVLYNSYLKDKNSIHANRIRRFYVKNDEIYSLNSANMYWGKYGKSYLNKLTGCGGVLYPPNIFNEEVFNEENFTKIIPTQDDVWFYGMAILNHKKIIHVAGYDIQLITIEDSQKYGLSKINKTSGKGMDSLIATRKLIEYYPEIKNIIKEK